MSFYEMDRTVQLTVNLECSQIHDTWSRADGTTDVNLECSLIHETWSRALRSYKRVESVSLWCETKPTAPSHAYVFRSSSRCTGEFGTYGTTTGQRNGQQVLEKSLTL